MRASDIAAFGERIEHDRRRARDGALLALLATAAVAPAALASADLALALVAGAGAELVLVSLWRARALMLVRALAARRDAYSIPEVSAFGRRSATPARRARLAGRLDDLRDRTAQGPLVARLIAHAGELDALAADLRSPQLELDPSCAVACLELLSDARRSPLLNSRLASDDLRVALHHIRAGFRPCAEPEGAAVGEPPGAPGLPGKRAD